MSRVGERDAPEDEGLVFEQVSKAFGRAARSRQALDRISLHVPRGRFVSVIGPSGCGKSTLLRLAAGLVSADSGSVRLYGEDVAVARREKRIGYVPQNPALLAWRSVLDNVRFPLEVNRKATGHATRTPEELLFAMGLGDVLHRHPAELSGGMQQRVAIARAFAFGPSVLLMDEPFSAVDEMTREALRHQLLALWQADQRIVVFVTHSVTEAVVLADEVVVMSPHPGRVATRIPVDLARPRTEEVEDSGEVLAVARAVRRALRSVSEQAVRT